MGSRLKEDERNERTIRALLKQSENRRCINCGSLGPQYVCTTFSIFVCTNCSGLHREFTHRIKSVSMAKFTAEEVRNLQAGGNERGREIFLKDYDLQRNSLPDSSNVDKLRDFIKSVYVERRYTGERPAARGRQGDRDDSYESRRPDRPEARSDGRSPPFEDRHDDRRFVERRRSDVDRGRYQDERVVRFEEKKSPGRFEPEKRSPGRSEPDRSRYDQKSKYDDRRQEEKNRFDERERDRRASYDDRFANEIRHDRRRSADDRPNAKELDVDGPPVRPVTEILGDNVPQLWVEEFRQTNGRDDSSWSSDSSPAEQRKDKQIPRVGSFGNSNGNTNAPSSTPIQRVNSGSLIDFNAEPEPTVVASSTTDPFQVSAPVVPSSAAVSTSSTGWATFDTALSATTTMPSDGPPAGYPDVFATPSNGSEWAASGWPSTQAPTTDDWSSLVAPSVPQPVMATGPQVLTSRNSFPPAGSNPALHSMSLQMQHGLLQPSKSASAILPPSVDRSKELPKELFAHSFPSLSAPAAGLGMGQQIPDFAPAPQPFGQGGLPTYAQPPRSRNPFDLPGDAGPSTTVGNFPSLGSLQTALPNGPLSMPTSMGPTSSNHWSMGLHPASYPPSGPAGGSGSAFVHQHSMPSSGMHAQTSGPSLGYPESGGFNSRGLFQADPSFIGSGSTEFPTQNFMRTVSGNPFG
ncbi:unnamed protein product [Calypogeia fissa]